MTDEEVIELGPTTELPWEADNEGDVEGVFNMVPHGNVNTVARIKEYYSHRDNNYIIAAVNNAQRLLEENKQLRAEKQRGFIEANKRLQLSAEIVSKQSVEIEKLRAVLLATKRITSQFGTPCWCNTIAGLYCVGQEQCKQAREALGIK